MLQVCCRLFVGESGGFDNEMTFALAIGVPRHLLPSPRGLNAVHSGSTMSSMANSFMYLIRYFEAVSDCLLLGFIAAGPRCR